MIVNIRRNTERSIFLSFSCKRITMRINECEKCFLYIFLEATQ